MKSNKKSFKIIFSALLLSLLIMGCSGRNLYTQDYIPGQGNIQGNVDVQYFLEKSADFDIGANKDGYAVFKNPEIAYMALTQNYMDAIHLIQGEFDLPALSQGTYKDYATYGWQVTTGTEQQKEDALFVSQFFDIYDNSYN